jgi:hypothetical protein
MGFHVSAPAGRHLIGYDLLLTIGDNIKVRLLGDGLPWDRHILPLSNGDSSGIHIWWAGETRTEDNEMRRAPCMGNYFRTVASRKFIWLDGGYLNPNKAHFRSDQNGWWYWDDIWYAAGWSSVPIRPQNIHEIDLFVDFCTGCCEKMKFGYRVEDLKMSKEVDLVACLRHAATTRDECLAPRLCCVDCSATSGGLTYCHALSK